MSDSVLEFVSGFVVALLGYLSTRAMQKTKRRSDDQVSQVDQIKWLSEEVRKLRADLDAEISKRRDAEERNHMLKRALREHVDFVDDVAGWVEKGSIPPPPDPPSPELRKLLEES